MKTRESMECNREEAVRAKWIAERKLEKKELTGAKRFAVKARNLFPDMDGLSQLMKTIDVYLSAENKISGEVDWYGVLEVKPLADEETLKKQYRKLALLLHPDKNKSVCADGAFKLVSEAWNLLSDKAKRLAYNQRRGYKGLMQKVHLHAGGPSAAPRPNGVFNFASRTTSVPNPPIHTTKPPKSPVNLPQKPSQKRTDTFWTICHLCKMHYEYLKMYLNQTLLCPNCRGAFMASETVAPQKFPNPSSQIPRQRQRNISEYMTGQNACSAKKNPAVSQNSVPRQAGSHLFRPSANQVDSISGSRSVGKDPSIAVKAANVVQHSQDKLKRPYNESHPHKGWEASIKKQKLFGEGNQFGMKYHIPRRNDGFGTTSGIPLESRSHGYSGASQKPNCLKDLTPTENNNMIMLKALSEIRNRVISDPTFRNANKKKNFLIKQGKKVNSGSMCNAGTGNGVLNQGLSSTDPVDHPGKGQNSGSANNTSKGDATSTCISVPDPDFHDFDKARDENAFGDNQVWSAYDDDDGMPRFYALVSRVLSRKPFKVRISWLNSKSNSEFSTVDWLGSGFYKTCGEFKITRYETCNSLNAFSQRVKPLKTTRACILIYPQRDEAWALYKNWSSDWNENTPDEIIHKYEMVTVVDNYNEEHGVLVAPLSKLPGFRTVFKPNMEQHLARRIPREEMFRFSHRVPYHLLTGQEAQNAPKGCMELDPAATPDELLKVIPVAENANTCAEGSRNSYENTEMASAKQSAKILKAQ